MKIDQSVRTTVRTVMTVTGETQKDVADGLGWSLQRFHGKVSGRARIQLDELEEIANHWKITAADLLQGPAHAISRVQRESVGI